MKTLIGFGSMMALAMTSMACSQSADAPAASSSTLEVTGTVDTHLRTLDNASAVAIGSDGKTFSAYVERNGHFKLSLPVGHVYRVVVANATMTGELRTVGHLVNNTSSGKSDVIAVKKGGKLDLGRVAPAGTSASTLKTACDCDESGSSGKPAADGSSKGSDDSSKTPDDGKDSNGTGVTGSDSSSKGDDSEDDYACHQKDQDKDSLCNEASDDVELTAEKSPGDACAKDDSDEAAPAPASKSCTAPDNDKDGKDDTSDPSSSAKDSSGDDSDSSSSPDPDGKGGGAADPSGGKSATSTGASCKCSSQCGAGASCVASHCLADN